MLSPAATFLYTINTMTVITIAIGVIGHIVSVIVYLRKPFRNNSISTYCIALAVVECLALFKFALIIGTLAYNLSYITDLSDELCKSFNYILTLLVSIQPFIMVAFSMDKLLSMRTKSFPMLKKKWFQVSIVSGIVLFNALIYIYYPILLKRRIVAPGRFVCDSSAMSFFTILTNELLIETFIFPFVIMIVTSVLTIRQLYKSRNSIERIGNVGKERKSRDAKFAITSLTLNVMFIILKLPFLIFYVLNAYLLYYDVYFYNIANFLFYLYTSSGFFIHLATNSIFRQEFLLLIRLKKISGAISSNKVSNTNRIIPL